MGPRQLRRAAAFIFGLHLMGWQAAQAEETSSPSPTTGSTDPQPKVVTPFATFYGTTRYTARNKQKYHAFTGIPYAQAPIGHRRFMAPEPIDDHPLHSSATTQPSECIQWDSLLYRGVMGSEDCLYLNVYTNRIAQPPDFLNTHPVMVLLHAGTWSSGGGANDIFSPEYLLEYAVMVITVNHRLGPFGFLTTESHDAPGNYALLDQIMALEWVRDNSRYFGGMNDSVTIMGSGAGGISTHLLTLSPRARGSSYSADELSLFQFAISQSGTAYSPHAFVRDPYEKAKMLAKKFQCKMTDKHALISCLKMVPAKDILEAMPSLYEWDEEPQLFGPVIDKGWMGSDAVIPDEPHNMIQHKQMLQVPWMVGTNQNDGAFRVQDILKDSALVRQLNTKWNKYGPLLLHLDKYSCKDPVDMANQIRDFYMGKSAFGEASTLKFVEMMTDRFFLYPTEKASKDHSYNLLRFKQYTYRYHLTYCGERSFLDILHKVNPKESADAAFGTRMSQNPRFQGQANNAHGWGVSFMDELLFLFPSSKLDFTYDSSYGKNDAGFVSIMMLTAWTNFAKGGDPTPPFGGQMDDISPWGMWWEPYVQGSDYYLKIDLEMETQDTALKSKQINFWKNLPLFENTDQNVIRDEL